MTGGWNSTGIFPGAKNYSTNATGSVTFNSSNICMVLTNSGGNNACGNLNAIYTSSLIDFTDYSTVNITLQASGKSNLGGAENQVTLRVSSSNYGSAAYYSYDFNQEKSLSNEASGTYTLEQTTFTFDISSVTGSKYFTLAHRIRIYDDADTTYISKIWLE